MPDAVTPEVLENSVKNALNAFETLKSDLLPKLDKLDGLDKAAFAKMEKAISDGVEQSQKASTAIKAEAEALKVKEDALESQIKALETAISRPGQGSNREEKAKELAEKRSEHFNKWSKKASVNQETFADYLDRTVSDEVERKSLTTGSDVNGGYLVMPEFGGVINTRVFESSPVRQLATVQAVQTDQYEVVLDNDEASAGWVGETATRSETNTPTLGKLIIPVNEIYANPKATQKMLDDGIVDVEGWLSGKVAEIFGRTEATAFVAGNGVLKPKGLLSYTAGTTISSQQVEQVNSGTSAAFTYNGLVDLQNALKEEYQSNAVFMIKRATNAALMKIVDGESRPIFNMTYDKNVGLTPTIMGKPVYFANDMEAIGAGSLSAIYGDIRQAYLILDRMGVRVLRDPFTAKPYVHFYTTKRVGAAVTNFEAYKIQKLA